MWCAEGTLKDHDYGLVVPGGGISCVVRGIWKSNVRSRAANSFGNRMRKRCGKFRWAGTSCLDLLLADGLGAEDGVLAGHAAREGAVEFCAESELAHVFRLFVVEHVALLDEALVLEALEALVPRLDLLGLWVAGGGRGLGEVRGGDGWRQSGCGAVGGHSCGGAVAG